MMYGMLGGCTTLFHLAVRYPLIVLSLSLAGFVSQVPSNPGVGDRMGTEAFLAQTQQSIISSHPGLPTESSLKVRFDALSPVLTEDQVRQVLKFTDACTDVSVKDVLSNPDERRDAAWLFYLDTYAREGPTKADQLFVRRSPPTQKK